MRRKTERRFLSTPIKFQIVLEAIPSAVQASSGANAKPWRFVVVQDQRTKWQIREASEEGKTGFLSPRRGKLEEVIEVQTMKLTKRVTWAGPSITISIFTQDYTLVSTISVVSDQLYATGLVFEELGVAIVPGTLSQTKEAGREMKTPGTISISNYFTRYARVVPCTVSS